jgi:hypothetical protein
MRPVTCAQNERATASQSAKAFGRYKKEQIKTVRQADVKPSDLPANMMRLWEAWKKTSAHGPSIMNYGPLEEFTFSAEQIERFSIILGALQDTDDFHRKAALCLNSMIAYGSGQDHIIHVDHISPGPLDYMGWSLNHHSRGIEVIKNITVIGDLDFSAGECMEAGRIEIHGDVGDFLGNAMFGGVIVVEGNAGHKVGERMNGGKIHVSGDIASVGDVKHGKIYHKGELIVDE